MATRKGKAPRRSVPQPIIVEEPPLRVACSCPHCGGIFDPLEMGGGWLARTCPQCGKTVTEADYDAAAAILLDRVGKEQSGLRDARLHAARAALWDDRFRRWRLRPLRRFTRRWVERTSYSADRIEERLASFDRKLRYLAKDRYYTGEWFIGTRCPLKREVIAPFNLVPTYRSTGAWHLPKGRGEVSGMTAEFAVFQRLLERVRNPESPLHGARVVANVYFPRERTRSRERFWDQVDCIVLTSKAAFVIEVKRRLCDVIVDRTFARIYSTRSKDEGVRVLGEETIERCLAGEGEVAAPPGWDDRETKALRQNAAHADAFYDAPAVWPFERVFEQIVFVGTRSFRCGNPEFERNANVCDASRFLTPIECTLASLDEYVSQAVVDATAERLVSTFGDLNQKRGLMHARRIRDLKSERSEWKRP